MHHGQTKCHVIHVKNFNWFLSPWNSKQLWRCRWFFFITPLIHSWISLLSLLRSHDFLADFTHPSLHILSAYGTLYKPHSFNPFPNVIFSDMLSVKFPATLRYSNLLNKYPVTHNEINVKTFYFLGTTSHISHSRDSLVTSINSSTEDRQFSENINRTNNYHTYNFWFFVHKSYNLYI